MVHRRDCTYITYIANAITKHFCGKQRCIMDGVINDHLALCLGVGIFLFPSFLNDLTSLHRPSCHGNDFSTCTSLFARVTSPCTAT